MLHISVFPMNRFNNPESGIFAPCVMSLLLKDLLFHNKMIITAADVKCNMVALKVSPYFTDDTFVSFGTNGIMLVCFEYTILLKPGA